MYMVCELHMDMYLMTYLLNHTKYHCMFLIRHCDINELTNAMYSLPEQQH